MSRILTAAALAAALAAPALAEHHGSDAMMAGMFENTAEVTYPDGSVINWHFNADYTVTNDQGQSGTWRGEGDETLCLSLEAAEGEEAPAERCSTIAGGPYGPGDTYPVTLSDGSQATVVIKEGRQ
ncbi:MAG: hypothetical protein MI723_03420 [Caulobacterales bacterium]|nr:hypothetical protein [Caulobacterales bacterium]